MDIRIEVVQTVFGRLQLRAADVGRAVQDLPLQVAEIHDVEIDETDPADFRSRQIKC